MYVCIYTSIYTDHIVVWEKFVVENIHVKIIRDKQADVFQHLKTRTLVCVITLSKTTTGIIVQ